MISSQINLLISFHIFFSHNSDITCINKMVNIWTEIVYSSTFLPDARYGQLKIYYYCQKSHHMKKDVADISVKLQPRLQVYFCIFLILFIPFYQFQGYQLTFYRTEHRDFQKQHLFSRAQVSSSMSSLIMLKTHNNRLNFYTSTSLK